ncbi:hypothetical protein LSAT2_005623 [Lamellibrachia satsuma]|nr:hypothetical protein LSAT2_005623 [Lamellibrachia satsuma]
MFALRQLVEKRLQGGTAVVFVDLEKAYDTVPREMMMATVRWMGVPEAEAKMVEAMFERTKGRVVVGSGLSEEFPINIGLRQGSALSPLLFIMVMEAQHEGCSQEYDLEPRATEHSRVTKDKNTTWCLYFTSHTKAVNLTQKETFDATTIP